METPLAQIKEALIRVLKDLDPDVDVFLEEIKSTEKEQGMEIPETYYFVEIIPNINRTVDKSFTDIGVLVDIAYHEKNESNSAYLIKAGELDGAFRPVFSFGDRNITIQDISQKVSDHVLHSSFAISFRQARQETVNYELMGELTVAAEKGE